MIFHISEAQVQNTNFCIPQFMVHFYYGIYSVQIVSALFNVGVETYVLLTGCYFPDGDYLFAVFENSTDDHKCWMCDVKYPKNREMVLWSQPQWCHKNINFDITLTCLLSTTSSDHVLSSNMHLPLLLNRIESTGKTDTQKHEFIVASPAYTVKLSKNVHMEK